MRRKRISPCVRFPKSCHILVGFICFTFFVQNSTSLETVEIFEGLPPGSAVLKLKRKPGIVYSLHRDSSTADGLSLFYIDSNGVLTSKVTLDYEDERGNEFDLLVISREISKAEGGFGSIVRVRILDRNDNPPKFPNDLYTCSMLENSGIGTYVQGLENVFASDLDSGKNSVRKYSIVGGNEAGKFDVDVKELDGVKFLRLKTKAPIDREETPFFVLTVKVEDGGIPSLSSATQIRVNILDENDQTPTFEPPIYSVAVSENVPVGTSVTQVKAFDSDVGTNAEIYYYFKPEDEFFTVNAHTGVVETACELNFEKGNSFDLTVYAVDRGKTPRQAETIVRIRLVDIESYPPLLGANSAESAPPVFQKQTHFVRIREDFPVGGAVVRVNAHQGSHPRHYERAWRYIIVNNPASMFHINPRSGVITLRKPLVFENQTSFSLVVKAQDEQSKDLYKSHARVEIVIEDVNENYFAPIFSRSIAVVSISENSEKNTVVSALSASDADDGSNGEIIYSVVGGSGLGKFNIDENTGQVRSIVRFNHEMDSQFDLHVRASDRSKQPLHSKAYLFIRLQNEGKKRPFFHSPRQLVSVRENSAKGTFVALVRAKLRTRRLNDKRLLEYFISSGNEGGKFSLNSTSGVISTADHLDRESKDLYILNIYALNKGAPLSMSSPLQVVVTVSDENDNSPSFEKHKYKVFVTENIGSISNLLCLAAHDLDTGENGHITYSIISGKGPFAINPVLGVLSVKRSLDYEKQSVHRLVIQAEDNGVPSRKTTVDVTIVVEDANDAPVFSQDHYEVTVLESAKIGTDLLAVFLVSDEDAAVKVTILENTDVEDTVAVLTTSDQDRDKNGKFTCSMENMDLETMDTFQVRRTPEGCALVLTGYLDWYRANKYSFSVRATDSAESAQRKSVTANVTIRVQDTNNHDPEFLQASYWVALPNDANMGATVLTVKARDLDEGKNADIRYILTNDVFSIHPTKGIITLKQGLGSVTRKKYEFSVRATDQGTPNRQTAVSVSVTVHPLSNIPPEFLRSEYSKVIPETFKTGAALLTVRAQKSLGFGGSVKYFIVGGDPLNQFSVGTRSGVLTLKKQLDYERINYYMLVVRAVHNGLSPSLPTEVKVFVNVTDVNDKSPRFALPVDPFVITVDEFQPPGTLIAVLKAYDRDTGNNSLITYRLEDANFKIHSYLGTLTTKLELYHSQGTSRSFVVTATDSTHPYRSATANVVVMINKAAPPPRFPNSELAEYVQEDTDVGKSLVQLRSLAESRFTLKYWVTDGNQDNQWCVDTTGHIRVNKPLDHEQKKSFHLKIKVDDGITTHIAPSVLFTVEDVNDNVPTFSANTYKFYVSENSPAFHTVAKVYAKDRDEGSNSEIKYSIVGVEDTRSIGKFEIDPTSGHLKTTGVLDREFMEQHVIMVEAEDAGKPSLSSLARLTVIVKDENDNSPVFATDLFRASVPVDAKVGSRIFSVIASDMDWGENRLLSYSVIAGNSEQFIAVDPIDGTVTVARLFTSLKAINFTVMARDQGQPTRNATADVIVTIHAIEGPPRFLASAYDARVAENKKAGTKVIRVQAASVDPVISYKILNGNSRKHFHLNVETGLLTTTRSLDYEKFTRYQLVVMAIDSSNRMNYVKVVVHVINVNDNEPYFVDIHSGIIEGQVLADAIVNSHVMWLKARDRDVSDVISYKIHNEKAALYFTVDSEGSLRTRRALQELQSPFVFKIEALDNGIPSRSTFTSVRLVFLRYHTQQRELQVHVLEDVKQDVVLIKIIDSAKIVNPSFSIIYPVGAPFRIDSESGEVRTSRPLDYETTQNYSLILQVQDSKNGKEYSNIDLVVEIEDVNDNSPSFTMEKEDGIYIAKINRNPVQGTVLYTLTASDRDSRGHLRYSLVTSSGENAVFEVEAESGRVKTVTQQVLMADFYNITVMVSDSDTRSRHTQAILHVQVGEYLPTFSREEYVFRVKENTRKGFTIGRIKAHSYSGASLSYTVVHGNVHKKFILDSNTGRLALPNPLDYERDSNVYYIRIRAVEVGVTQRQSSEVNVQVLLKDMNDNAPEFSQQRYRYILPESAPVGTMVLVVSARDSDSGVNGQFRYYMNSRYFSVNPYTGEITTTKPLDYETARSHTFDVMAQDGGKQVLHGTARVEVTLQNVNDNPPRFSQTVYNSHVNEDAGPGELVTTVQASDLDLDPVSYSIISGDDNSNFVIDNRTGVVRLVSHRAPSLVGPYYELNISASDGLHTSQAVLIVAIQDINNHKPVFKDCDKYKPVISENVRPGSSVIQVSAEDRDMGQNGEVSYHIERPSTGIRYFKINSASGLVTTAVTFDREEKRSYQIRITGKDGGPGQEEGERLMGFCQLEIRIDDVNDNDPVFSSKTFITNVKEDLEKGHIVLHVTATDKDAGSNSLITYSLEKPNKQFLISNSTGIITTKGPLTSTKYNFKVIAQDNGNPRRSSKADVEISVYKAGKDPPKFTKDVYIARVREDVRQGYRVERVLATSPNQIYYSIVNYPQPVNIDPVQGIITTQRTLDYELASNYTIHILAQDNQDPPLMSFARLEILVEDVNDSPPQFPVSKYEGQVAENSRIGSSVIEVKADDPDMGENGMVSYTFKESYKSFELNSKRGLITTKKIFDREETGRYTLIVEARDHGDPPKSSSCIVDVIISDQNDNRPVFEQTVYNASVHEDASRGTNILEVSAVDDDIGNNAVVNYFITAGNTRAAFAINKDLGQIVVASSLDRETHDYYQLKIRALDGKNSGTAVVNIHVKDANDNTPVFTNTTYVAKVYENQPAGSYVTTLSASDKDLGLGGAFLFSISGQGKDAFDIDPNTGIVTTIKPLDREAKGRYDFLAFATDNPNAEPGSRRTGSCDVVVWIRDVNDKRPHFPDDVYEGTVKENQLPGARVMVLSAVDEDDPNENGNAVISYELIDDAGGLFKIDRDSGLITTRRRLDRETDDEYQLVVNATDRGRPALWGQVEVMIRVADDNDHPPRFTEQTFVASIFENASIDSSVMKLKATDEDIGSNSRLRYSIIAGAADLEEDGSRMFRIVEDTGVLQVARSLDYETQKQYTLKVKVSDSSSPFFSDKADVMITVQDYNDNPPVFNPVSYAQKVNEDVTPEYFLMKVTATDSDSGSNRDFKFSIFEGDPDGQFRIDPEQGNLYVHRRLDREKRAVYLLTVRATNTATPPLYGHASVKITLNDVNDNGPTFHPSEIHFSIKENTEPPQYLGKISVDDPDLDPPNGAPFFFEIVNGNEEGLFELNNRTGEMFTRKRFDREERESYRLVVAATDSGKPKKDSKTSLFVHILDVNDHQHSVGLLNLELNSYQGKFPGGKIGKMYVEDKDIDDDRHYKLISNSSRYFTIQPTTGMIISQPNPPEGNHFLSAIVSDTNSSFKSVICSVFIKVKQVSAEAVHNSMAIRLGGVSCKTFVSSVLARFKESVGSILQTDEDNVDLFSVQDAPRAPRAIDVRFAAHGSPYYAPEKMIAILKNNRPSLVKAMAVFDVKVLAVGVDECLHEPCESGGCTNVLLANGEVEVISVKATSFASIVAILEPRCDDCMGKQKETTRCESEWCLNGGTCLDTPQGHKCRCLKGHNGPNCEFSTRSFVHGEWLWLPAPEQCSVGSLSLEFATREANGLLLYGGPTSPVREGDVHDFITLELAGGKILVTMSLGDRNDVVRVGVTGGMDLNDGEWHHIEVYRDGSFVRVTVDKCKGVPVVVEEMYRCSSTAKLSKKNKFLNLNGPLQLGGVSTTNLLYPNLTVTNYEGCIRNVINQGRYYDLKTPIHRNGTKEGCPMVDQHCRSHQCDALSKCVPSWTGYSCHCPFGFTGSTCGKRTRALSYAEGSYTKYLFYERKINNEQRETKIQMQIRTRDPDGGVLMYNYGSEEGRFSLLEVVPYDIDGDGESEVIVTYTLGYKNQSSSVLQLTGVNVGNGQWHNISVVRERTHVTLSVDSDGDGYSVTEQLGIEHTLFTMDPTRNFIGGVPPSSTSSHRRADIGKDFVGCINDVRFNGHLLYYYNGTNALGNALSVGVSEGCLAEPMCEPNPCNISEWCRDVWRKFVCLPRLCTWQPCKNGGTCFEGADSRGNNKFFCKCPLGFEGALCDVRGRSVVVTEVTGARLEDGLIIGLAVLVVTLILSASILFVYLRRSQPKKCDVFVEEDQFKRDNVANYRIEGGGEMDLEEEDQVRDILRSFETNDFSPCQNKKFKLSGSNGDVSGSFVVLTPLKREVIGRQPNGMPDSKPVQRSGKPDEQDIQRSYSQEGSDQEPPDSSSSPSAVSTPERRRRVRTSSKGDIVERHSPEGGEEGVEGGVEGSPTRKLAEVFGLSEEEQEGMRSPPEGFSSPEKYESLSKRERGNGASLQRPNRTEEESRKPPQNMEESPLSYNGAESFAMENPLSRPNSDLPSSAVEDGFPPVQRNSIPPRKPPRACFPRGVPPPPGNFIPEDAMQRFYYEGAGSPTISLSTLGDTEGESEADDNYDYVNQMGDKFKKLARICGQTPSVTFSPHDEVIGE